MGPGPATHDTGQEHRDVGRCRATNGNFLPDAVAVTAVDQSDRTQVVGDLLESHLVSDRTVHDRFSLGDARSLLLHSNLGKIESIQIA